MKKFSGIIFAITVLCLIGASCILKGSKQLRDNSEITSGYLDTINFKQAVAQLISTKDSAERAFYNQLYKPTNYFSFWINDQNRLSKNIGILTDYFSKSTDHGIQSGLFRMDEITDLYQNIDFNNIDYNKLAALELRLTKSYYDYCAGMKFGFFNPRSLYPDEYFIVTQKPDSLFTRKLFSDPDSLTFYLDDVQPITKEYQLLQDELARMQTLTDSVIHKIPPIVDKQTIRYGDKHPSVPLIARRLMISGELPYNASYKSMYTTFNNTLLKALNQFREKYNLLIDKEIGNQTIQALNRDFGSQYWIVAANLERLRWIPQKTISTKYVHVNVANMTLSAMRNDDPVLRMHVCVGEGPDHKTPLLYGKMYEIVLNPTWTVPNNIIINEISKKMVNDPSYLSRNNMKVYKNREPVDEYSIQWNKINKNYQPYVIVQDSGANNSLGRIKFNFGNPFDVYLHDTNVKSAFSRHNRAISHGCVRVQKPLDLAFFCLNDVDSTKQKLVNQNNLKKDKIRYSIGLQPLTQIGKDSIIGKDILKLSKVELRPGVSILLDYRTCFSGKNGDVQFCNDHYKMDSLLIAKIKSAK